MAKIDPNRRDPAVAQEVMEYIYPDPAVRYFVNTVLATAILSAHRFDPNKWSITLHYKRDLGIRVNVGMLEVLILAPFTLEDEEGVFDVSAVYMVLHKKDFSLEQMADWYSTLDAFESPSSGLYKNAPGSNACGSQADLLPHYFPDMKSSWQSIIKIASTTQRQPSTNATTHSSGVVEYLRQEFPDLEFSNPPWFYKTSD